MKENQKRIYFLDQLRGVAIIAMLIHHVFYFAGFIFESEPAYAVFDTLCVFQPFFWTVFIVTSGICSQLSRNSVKRGFFLLGFALGLSLVTVVIMPRLGFSGQEVYFGILHCLGCSMVITGLFKSPLKKTNKIFGMTLCIVLFALTYHISDGFIGLNEAFSLKLPTGLREIKFLFPLGIMHSRFSSADYFPLLPWFFMFLFGAILGTFAADGKVPGWAYKNFAPPLTWAGKNSLWIYIGFQPVILVLFYIIKIIFKL